MGQDGQWDKATATKHAHAWVVEYQGCHILSHRLMEQVMDRMILHNYIGVVYMGFQGYHIIPWTQCWMGWTVGYSYRACMDSESRGYVTSSHGLTEQDRQGDIAIM